MGFRLPLDSCPGRPRRRATWIYERDPLAPRAAAAARARSCAQRAPAAGADGAAGDRAPPRRGESAPGVVRTALCVEPRDGILHVFMPPVGVARGVPRRSSRAIEDARARARACRCSSRATTPPRDHRLEQLQVTPDPGRDRGEHPPGARSWDELVDEHDGALRRGARTAAWAPRSSCSTAATPAPAAATTSCSAAPTPADSPFLRRPDLLRSLIGYWLNHPSLSYLFSGLFVGPDQPGAAHRRGAPATAIYELEIAFAQVPTRGRRRRRGWSIASSATCWSTSPATPTAPSSASTSSTAPTAPAGRQGLVELRAFEMPPHARMSLAQQLLRARAGRLVLARRRTERKLVRWGTGLRRSLHAAALRRAGLRRRAARPARRRLPVRRATGSAPHYEFRFPLLGAIARGGHRAGAAPGDRALARAGRGAGAPAAPRATSTRRSSACRCKVRGMTDARHVVACNGRRVPLHPTGTRRASTWRACATAPGSRRRRCTRRSACTRRWCSTCSTPGPAARSAAAPTTSSHPGRPRSRDLPANALEAEGAAHRALLPLRPHAGPDGSAARGAQPRLPAHARPPPPGVLARRCGRVSDRVASMPPRCARERRRRPG